MYVKMCYVPYVAIFYSISKRERYQWCLYVMLCREQVLYSYSDCFSTVFQQNLPICSVFAGFLCIALWCWLDVWFSRLATVPLFACSSTQSVCLVMAHPFKYSSLLYEVFFAFRIWNEFCLLCQPKVCFIGLWDNSRSNSMLLLNTAGNCTK